MWHVGFARKDITAFEPGILMLGWGMLFNQAYGVEAPLYARASVVEDTEGGRFAFVVVDMLVVTQALWQAVVERLETDHAGAGIGAHNLIFGATHTHSAPSGYGQRFWMNLNAPGFSQPVFDRIVDGVTTAVVEAHAVRKPATARLCRTTIGADTGIAFNRSWFAYSRNKDTDPVPFESRDQAVERVMTALRFDDADGAPIGMLNWFGLHGTCVHADNKRLHPDHKGVFATALEAEGIGIVAAQECAGDVSPNFRMDKKRGHTVGRGDDDFANAAYVGGVQADHARTLLDDTGIVLDGPLQVASRYFDFSGATVDAQYTPSGKGATTVPATVGIAMARGTAEGPGPLRRSKWVSEFFNGAKRRTAKVRARLGRPGADPEDPKFPLVDLGLGLDGTFAGFLSLRKARVPAFDPVFRWVRDQIRANNVHEGPWIPQVVPLQLVRLGGLVIAGMPFELTTVAGRRLRASIKQGLGDDVEKVVLTTYCSAYMGYCTTFEEYQVQHYEAAYTLFGPHTLGALQTAFAGLVNELRDGSSVTDLSGPTPGRVPQQFREKLRFERPWAT